MEIGRDWREVNITCSTQFCLKDLSNGEVINKTLKQARFTFLKKTKKVYCLRFTCPDEESALEIERAIKALGFEGERRGKETIARCELEVGRKLLQERIKGEGIVIAPFEEEIRQARIELEMEGERRILSSDSRLRLIPLPSKEKEPSLLAVSLNGAPPRRFRGELEIFVNSAFTPELVNELELEDYLKGVLPAEIASDFPSEALKAQAIVARTYAVYSLGRHKKEGFDLCSGRHCQIYLGYDYEKAKLNSALEETKGMIISYNGKPALTPFHSSCGGISEDASIWGTSLPYLKEKPDCSSPTELDSEEKLQEFLQRKDGFNCQSAPDFRWVREYYADDLQKIFTLSLPLLLHDSNLKIGSVKDLKVLGRSASGRVRALKIVTEDKEIILTGDDIRWAFGNGRPASKGSLPSLLFYVEKGNRNLFRIVGGGSGHGVGFCQWGAVGLAKKGYDHIKIIDYYFPGTTLTNLKE